MNTIVNMTKKQKTKTTYFKNIYKGCFFLHSGKIYLKTNISEVICQFSIADAKIRGMRYSDLPKIKFNAVRISDINHPNKIGSRGTFNDETIVTPIKEICIDYFIDE